MNRSTQNSSFLLSIRAFGLLLVPFGIAWLTEMTWLLPRNLSSSSFLKQRDSLPYFQNDDDDFNDDALLNPEAALIVERFADCHGKERFVEILVRTGMGGLINDRVCQILPEWSETTRLYGDKPVVVGLDRCERFRASLHGAQAKVRVAGLYNTGTNALAISLDRNLYHNRVNDTIAMQVPEGKHKPLSLLQNRTEFQDKAMLPVVLVRDPYRWMKSMCKISNHTEWQKGLNDRCPNLVPSKEEMADERYQNISTFEVNQTVMSTHYKSLADMWSQWNSQWVETDMPRLIIRFEDTIFHAEKVMDMIADCAGIPLESDFEYTTDRAKHTKKAADFFGALSMYGREDGRYDGLATEDKLYAETALDPGLMKLFHYSGAKHSAEDHSQMAAALVSNHADCRDKEKILEILLRAGKHDLSKHDCVALPSWSEIVRLYGEEPIILGLDTCEEYRSHLSPGEQPKPRVAGLFNTGTNALVDSLDLNFHKTENRLEYNLPGGKHSLLRNRIRNPGYNSTDLTKILPVVLIRDPFRWMNSMCKDSYKASWLKGVEGHCPSLVPTEEERQYDEYKNLETFEVTLDRDYDEHYASVADMWSVWNREYFDSSEPRLMIRFEDTLFHAEKVMEQITACVGQPLHGDFRYHLDAAKEHGNPADFVTALSKYGREQGRYGGLEPGDRVYANEALDQTLMATFHYPQVPVIDKDETADRQIERLVRENMECEGKEKLLQILLGAGKEELHRSDCQSLPKWAEVSSLYGDQPIVFGLDTCQAYRAGLQRAGLEADIRVGGLFNTGTNALADSLGLNFRELDDKLDYNVPGGKHTPLGSKKNWLNAIRGENSTPNPHVMPVILIRDPFRWMNSMCKDSYAASWDVGMEGHCPNLVPSKEEVASGKYEDITTFEVTVDRPFDERYASLADMWSGWYQQYLHAEQFIDPFPRLIIRFEDTLFHAEKVMELIVECVGETMKAPFQYHLEAAKEHGKPADFIAALSKYGREEGRYGGLTDDDMSYAQSALDSELMHLFHYKEASQVRDDTHDEQAS